MSDCSTHAFEARPIRGKIVWKDGQRPSELSYARYVNGHERVADYIDLDGVDYLPVVRCRDCKHATITVDGMCKYCEMFWLPDTDGYGADPQVYLPGDFFCAWGERKES